MDARIATRLIACIGDGKKRHEDLVSFAFDDKKAALNAWSKAQKIFNTCKAPEQQEMTDKTLLIGEVSGDEFDIG